MNVTKSIKYVKYTMRVYNLINKELLDVTMVYFRNTPLKQIKKNISNKGYNLLEIINTEYFTTK